MDRHEQAKIVLFHLMRLKAEGRLEGLSIIEAAEELGAARELAELVQEIFIEELESSSDDS